MNAAANKGTGDSPRRAVIVRFGALGDLILCTPLMRALSQRWGGPTDLVALGSWPPLVFKGLPYAGEIRTISSKNRFYWISPDQWSLTQWLRGSGHAEVYVVEDDWRACSLIERSGVQITAKLAGFGVPSEEHVVDTQARLAGFSGGSYDRDPELQVSEAEQRDADAWIHSLGFSGRPVVLFQPGSKRTMLRKSRRKNLKYWPEESWAEVVRGVLRDLPNARAIIMGTATERGLTEAIATATGDDRCLSGAGQLPLRRLFALLRRAHSIVSVDTGPAHAAAALSCPAVVLFGDTNPARNRPLSSSSPVRVVAGQPEAKPGRDAPSASSAYGMEYITTDQVVGEWKELCR